METIHETIERCQAINDGLQDKEALVRSFGFDDANTYVTWVSAMFGTLAQPNYDGYIEQGHTQDEAWLLATADMMLWSMVIGRERERAELADSR